MSMELTKRLWEQPTDKGVLAYHIIQSFSPGEATPDQVHEIGCEFARRFLADRFECTVSTHLDKGHLHNHSVCIVCNDSGKIDKLPPNRLYGHTDFLAGTFFVCGSRRGDFVSLTDKQLARYEKIYHFPIVFLPTPHGLLAMKCTPEQYEQFQRDGNKLKIRPIDHGER